MLAAFNELYTAYLVNTMGKGKNTHSCYKSVLVKHLYKLYCKGTISVLYTANIYTFGWFGKAFLYRDILFSAKMDRSKLTELRNSVIRYGSLLIYSKVSKLIINSNLILITVIIKNIIHNRFYILEIWHPPPHQPKPQNR